MILNKILKKIFLILKLRPSSYPFISGDGFRKIADFIHDETGSFNPFNTFNSCIIFVKSDKLHEFFTIIHPKIKNSYILISHNSDENIDSKYFEYIDTKIIHWFAQNNIEYHRKITPIPIGLENFYLLKSGFPLFFKKKIFKEKIPKILYGFNVKTNIPERTSALKHLEIHKESFGIPKRINVLIYISLLKKYGFVASPPGNGFDCIRTWEALYLHVIPIVRRGYNTEFFLNIGCPLLLVDSWEDLKKFDKDFLDTYYKNNAYRFYSKAITMDYWVKKINSYKL
ncbi:MAG: hypothetical protein RLY49_307 [Candidatus Parcubacteria bacterium]|jgi:hypothetical protein